MEEPRSERAKERKAHWRRTLGWTHWPFYIWTPVPRGQGRPPGVFLSVLHTGYAFALAALSLDLFLWLVLRFPQAPVFLLGHQVWISLVISLLLLNGAFLQHLDGRPLSRLGPANVMSLGRLCLLPLLVYLLCLRLWRGALIGYILLGLSDVADGAVARRRGEESKLGFVLDPFADILFHLGILVSLAVTSVFSWVTVSLVIVRYALLLIGSAVLYALKGEIWIQPTPFGKATGLAIAFLTSLVLLRLGIGGEMETFRVWADRTLGVLFAACIVHVVLIGRINYLRPTQGGSAVYRRGWGLLVGHRSGDPQEEPTPLNSIEATDGAPGVPQPEPGQEPPRTIRGTTGPRSG